MIYMEPEVLSYRPIVQSYLDFLMENNPKYAFRACRPSKVKRSTADEDAGLAATPAPGAGAGGDHVHGDKAEAAAADRRMFTIDATVRKLLEGLIEWLVDPLLVFLRKRLAEYVPTQDTTMVHSLLTVFECMMGQCVVAGDGGAYSVGSAKFKGRSEPTQQDVESFFMCAIVWSIGATVTGEAREAFSEFVRGATEDAEFLKRHPLNAFFKLRGWKDPVAPRKLMVPLPTRGTLYQSFYSAEHVGWKTWDEVCPRSDIADDATFAKIIVQTVETTQFAYIVDLLVSRSRRTLVCGPTGTGKSAYMNRFVAGLPLDAYAPITISFSAQTTARQAQDIVDAKLERRRKGVYGPRLGIRAVLFVDDLNMCARACALAARRSRAAP